MKTFQFQGLKDPVHQPESVIYLAAALPHLAYPQIMNGEVGAYLQGTGFTQPIDTLVKNAKWIPGKWKRRFLDVLNAYEGLAGEERSHQLIQALIHEKHYALALSVARETRDEGLWYLTKGLLYLALGEKSSAKQSFLKGYESKKHGGSIQCHLDVSLLRMSTETEGVEKILKELLERFQTSDDAGYFRLFGDACYEAGRLEEALTAYSKVPALFRNPWSYRRFLIAAVKVHQLSITDLQKKSFQNENPELYFIETGMAYDHGESVDDLEKLATNAAQENNRIGLYYLNGILERKKGNYIMALGMMNQSLEHCLTQRFRAYLPYDCVSMQLYQEMQAIATHKGIVSDAVRAAKMQASSLLALYRPLQQQHIMEYGNEKNVSSR